MKFVTKQAEADFDKPVEQQQAYIAGGSAEYLYHNETTMGSGSEWQTF